MTDSNWILLASIVGGACLAAYFMLTVVRVSRTVEATSDALKDLARLNARFSTVRDAQQPIKLSFIARVNSKAKYDRFNLEDYLLDELDRNETQIGHQISTRQHAVQNYSMYEREYQVLENTRLGQSTQTTNVNPERFARIELRRFSRRKLKRPAPRAKVTVGVTYRSPQGRNSYARSVQLTFDDLVRAMNRMRHARQQRTAYEQQRNTERAKMTDAIRVDVFRRDGYTCRFCGARPPAVVLHVDHIVPVSRGGLTEMDNLQTLCASCNLGKGNRFSG